MDLTIAEDRWNWVGVIETVSGIKADIFNMTDSMFDIEDIATSLSNICRYNGHLPHFYSVAEHSVLVADWLNDSGHDRKTILTGLLHDASEAYVGDMVRPLKRHQEYGVAHQRIEELIAEKISAKYGAHFPYPEAVHEADKQVYYWEVEHIRSGKVVGLHPRDAKDLFLHSFDEYYLTA